MLAIWSFPKHIQGLTYVHVCVNIPMQECFGPQLYSETDVHHSSALLFDCPVAKATPSPVNTGWGLPVEVFPTA